VFETYCSGPMHAYNPHASTIDKQNKTKQNKTKQTLLMFATYYSRPMHTTHTPQR